MDGRFIADESPLLKGQELAGKSGMSLADQMHEMRFVLAIERRARGGGRSRRVFNIAVKSGCTFAGLSWLGERGNMKSRVSMAGSPPAGAGGKDGHA